MRAWVLVPNHNGAQWLPGLVASIAGQTRTPDRVLFIDDASTDGSREWLSEHGHDALVLSACRGFAAAVNAGLAEASRAGVEVVAVVNTDIELAHDWLECGFAALESDPAVGSVATKMVRLDDPAVIDDAGDWLRRDGVCEQRGRGHKDSGQWDAGEDVWGACAGAALYRTAALDQVGFFDERYGMYLEDVDLSLRLQLAGWSCRYVPAVARHAGGGSGAALSYWVARNSVILTARWFPLRWLPMVIYRHCSWLASAARQRRLTAHMRGLISGLRHAPAARLAHHSAGGASYDAVAAAIPARPWRGRQAGGHREAGE